MTKKSHFKLEWAKRINEKITEYTDEIKIYAGIFTFLVTIWAIIFYNHRQKKWKEIMEKIE